MGTRGRRCELLAWLDLRPIGECLPARCALAARSLLHEGRVKGGGCFCVLGVTLGVVGGDEVAKGLLRGDFGVGFGKLEEGFHVRESLGNLSVVSGRRNAVGDRHNILQGGPKRTDVRPIRSRLASV